MLGRSDKGNENNYLYFYASAMIGLVPMIDSCLGCLGNIDEYPFWKYIYDLSFYYLSCSNDIIWWIYGANLLKNYLNDIYKCILNITQLL